jgi:hypothetical protein
MASAIWSRNSEYFRGLCTNQLKIEDDGGLVLGEGGACPPACVQPFPRTPVPTCGGCDPIERPNEWPQVMTLKLPGELTYRDEPPTSGSGGTRSNKGWSSGIDFVYLQTTEIAAWQNGGWPPQLTGTEFQIRNHRAAYEESGEEPGYNLYAGPCHWMHAKGTLTGNAFKADELATAAPREVTIGPTTYRSYGLEETGDPFATNSVSMSLGNSYFRDWDLLSVFGWFGGTQTVLPYHKTWQKLVKDNPIWQDEALFYIPAGKSYLTTVGPGSPIGEVAFGYAWRKYYTLKGYLWKFILGGTPYLELWGIHNIPTWAISTASVLGPHYRSSGAWIVSYHLSNSTLLGGPLGTPMYGGPSFPGSIVEDPYSWTYQTGPLGFSWPDPVYFGVFPFGDRTYGGTSTILGRWRFDPVPCSKDNWIEGVKYYDYNDVFSSNPRLIGPTNLPEKLWINVGTSGL